MGHRVEAGRINVESARLQKQLQEDWFDEDLTRVNSATKESVNEDRLTCLRQDDLDLVIPSSQKYIVRQVVPINGGDTDRDIYVTATKVRIDKIAATLNIVRVGSHSFRFTLTGDSSYDGQHDVAAVDFYIEGLQVLSRSSAIDWIASLAANRQQLKEGQTGKLYFKLVGEAEAKWNSRKQQWEVNLLEKNTKVAPFQFDIGGQYILQEALTRRGGIDKVMMDSLWPAIKDAVPMSLAQAFHYLSPDELSVSLTAKVSGRMTQSNGPLQLDLEVTSNLDVVPAAVLQAFQSEDFDFAKLAETQVDMLLARGDVQELWRSSRDAFIQQLGHLGYLFDDELTSTILAADELAELRPQLMQIAKSRADALLKILQPFVDARKEGKQGFFAGLESDLVAEVGWDENTNDGRFSASLHSGISSGNETFHEASLHGTMHQLEQPIVKLPAKLLDAMGAPGSIACGVGRGSLLGEGFSFRRGSLGMSRVQLKGFLVHTGNETASDTYKLNGEAHDISLSLPRSLDPGITMSIDSFLSACEPSGDLSFSLSPDGLVVQEAPRGEATAQLLGEVRGGDETLLDGKLSSRFARQTETRAPLGLLEVAPVAATRVGFKVKGSGHRLTWTVKSKSRVTVKVDTALRSVLAKRPTEDFGYVFFSGQFQRHVVNGESGVPASSDVVAVVSCGYLRLLKRTTILPTTDPLKRIDMESSGGQLQLDLTKYRRQVLRTSTAQVPRPKKSGSCMDLYSAGYPARQTGYWPSKKNVVETLCGPTAEIQGLAEAIALQVRRFQDERARMWDFGTHPADTSQYVLPLPNSGTLNLTTIAQRNIGMVSPSSLVHTESAERNSVVNSAGAKMSVDRGFCRVREDLDRKIFPPDKYGTKAIRMAKAGVPGVGDLYLILDKIQITEIDLLLKLSRKSSDTFSLEIVGDQSKFGKIDAWIEGLDFETPDTSLGALVGGLANTENVLWQVLTLGMGSREHGRLDRGKVDVLINVRADFKYVKNGGVGGADAWAIVPETAHPEVSVDFGAGGLVQYLVNLIIEKAGGVNQMFVDAVWPLVEKLISPKLGHAFETVDFNSGQIMHTLRIKGKCENPDPDNPRRCPAEELVMDIHDLTNVIAIPRPIITSYLSTSRPVGGQSIPSDDESYLKVLQRMLKAYQQGESVFKDADIYAMTRADLNVEKVLTIKANAETKLAMPLLRSLVGADSSLIDFIPNPGTLAADGSLSSQNGVITLPNMQIKKLRLPVVLSEGTDALELDVTLKGLTVERTASQVNGVPSTEPSLIFDESSPLGLRIPYFETKLDRQSGLVARLNPETLALDSVLADLAGPYVSEMLRGATEVLGRPANVREGPKEDADGQVPEKFRRPASHMMAYADVTELLKSAAATIEVSAHAVQPPTLQVSARAVQTPTVAVSARAVEQTPTVVEVSGNHAGSFETIDFRLTASIGATLKVGNNFWRGLLDVKDTDYGYIHAHVLGRFGEFRKCRGRSCKAAEVLPQHVAVALLDCGTLDIYIVKSASDEPFEKPSLSVDLTKGLHGNVLNLKEFDNGWSCMVVQEEEGNWFNPFDNELKQYLCGSTSAMQILRKGISLQIQRFRNVPAAVRKHPVGSAERKAAPDGTWFVALDPKDATTWYPEAYPPTSMEEVVSPKALWQAAWYNY